MSDVEFSEESEVELHPIVEANQELFDKLVDITDKMNELLKKLKELKTEKTEIESQISDIIRELPSDEQNDIIDYRSIKVKVTTQTKVQVGKRRQRS